ncbi:MAG: ABC transporter permease [Bacteroidales bacterium]|jgi:ABC-2 type transport system permease protein|nr:ABC transporter permease [Bacteroidales bacterium]
MNNIITGLRISITAYRNELKAIFSDKGVMLILFFAVIAYLLVYSIGYKNNVLRELPISVVDLDHTKSSRVLSKMLNETEQVAVITKSNSLAEAEKLFNDGKVNGIVLISADFEKSIFKGQQADIVVYADAGYFLIYKETLNAALKASGTFSAGVEIKRNIASGSSFNQAIEQQHPLDMKFYNLYNPSGAYGTFVMPGMIIIILQQTLLVGIGMLGGAGREKNNNKFVAPGVMLRNGSFSVVMGKGLAYFTVYIVNIIFTLIWLYNWFDFPDKGSLLNVIMLVIPFLFSVIFLGLTISLLFSKRENSIIFLVFLSPIVLFLTGLSWPVSSLPKALYYVAHIFPSTTMVPAFIRIRTMGVAIQDVRFELIFLIVQMIAYYLLASLSYKYFAKKHALK